MRTASNARPLFGLFGDLTRETKTFVRQEIELAKTEMAEKLHDLAGGVTSLLIGGFVAYAGVIVFFIGLGLLATYALQRAGLDPVLAAFIGLGAVGLLIVASGTILLFKGLKAFSADKLAPRRTLHTLHELRGNGSPKASPRPKPERPKRTSAQLEARVEHTENRLSETIDELGYRLNPRFLSDSVKDNMSRRPYRAGFVALGLGLCAGWYVTRKSRSN